jgi:hypothetical protein
MTKVIGIPSKQVARQFSGSRTSQKAHFMPSHSPVYNNVCVYTYVRMHEYVCTCKYVPINMTVIKLQNMHVRMLVRVHTCVYHVNIIMKVHTYVCTNIHIHTHMPT